MRFPLLCSVALLCAAGAVQAQGWPGQQGYYPSMGYYPNQGYYTPGYPVQPNNYSNGFYHFQQYQPPAEWSDPGQPVEPRVWPEGPKKQSWCWFNAEYAFAFIRSPNSNVPLVTSTTQVTPRAGALDDPNARVIYSSNIGYDQFSGIRTEFGAFLDKDHTVSVEGVAQWLPGNHERFSATSDGNGTPGILRPVFDVTTGTELALIDALPGVAAGRVDVDARSEMFGFELNTRYHHCLIEDRWYVDGLVGFRYLRLAESLTIRDQVTPLSNGVLRFLGTNLQVGDSLADQDTFLATNKFYGGQVGGRMRFEGCWWLVHLQGKIAVGATDEEGTINGFSQLRSGASTQIASGGILALPSNSGTNNVTLFGIVPEGSINFGLKFHNCVQLTAGYNFLYWSQVIRPSSLIDRTVNVTTIPTAQAFSPINTAPFRPTPNLNGEGFWVHSLSLKLAVAF